MTAPAETDLLAQPTGDLLATAQLGDEARALINGAATRREAIDALISAQLMADAVRLLGAIVPPLVAIRWASACARARLAGAAPDDPRAALLETAEAWLREPGEESRRAAGRAALATEMDSAAAWAAMAVFWSGGSIAPPEAPPVEPAPGSAAKAAIGAVLMAATTGPPPEINARFKKCLDLGIALAKNDSSVGV